MADAGGGNPFLARRRRLLVFDLDGTLVDSLGDIASSVNAVRSAHRAGGLSLDVVREAVGAGARVLVERTMPEVIKAGTPVDALYGELLAQYRIHCVRDPALFPGARRFLGLAARQSVPLAVLTNKPLEIAELTLRAAGLRPLFVRVLAPENAARKPDPGGLLTLVGEFSLTPGDAILFGDSGIDFETGRNAGVFTIGLRGGYGKAGETSPDLWADHWDIVSAWWEEGHDGVL